MNYQQEITAMKASIERLSAENDELKTAMQHAKTMIDVFEETFLDMFTDLVFAHEKINGLLYQNPTLVDDMAAMEKIVGPLDNPTPRAPAHS